MKIRYSKIIYKWYVCFFYDFHIKLCCDAYYVLSIKIIGPNLQKIKDNHGPCSLHFPLPQNPNALK